MVNKPIRYLCFLLLYWSIMFSEMCLASASAIDPLKVAYIYNIAKFTRWPEANWVSPSAPFQLCFYGNNNVAEALQVLQKKTVDGHPIVLFKPKYERDFQQCHAFYIDTAKRQRYRYLLSLINQKTVLVISDDSPFFEYGGLVNLVEQNQRLRFQVNTQELQRSQLKFSSKLLKLAILVDDPR